MLRKWNDLPESFQCEEVREYYDILNNKKVSLFITRLFDIFVSAVLLVLLSPVLVFIALWIKLDSEGPVFFRQERITTYGETFRIFKFRTMKVNNSGSSITLKDDDRITSVGKKIRKLRIDEFPQLINILKGEMTLVGTRPEVKKYVDAYTNEMKASLLLPAGVTSLASIKFKDEDELLQGVTDIDTFYIEKILPEKMKYNLEAIRNYSFLNNIKIIFMTVGVLKG